MFSWSRVFNQNIWFGIAHEHHIKRSYCPCKIWEWTHSQSRKKAKDLHRILLNNMKQVNNVAE